MSRARKSTANSRPGKNLTAPQTLTPDERELWDTIVRGQSPAWAISGCEAVLACHVRTAVYLETLAARKTRMLADPETSNSDLADIDALIDKAARLQLATSRALRLVQVSRVRENLPKDRPRMPWEIDPDESY